MNLLVCGWLGVSALAWLAYMLGLRKQSIAFILWFPLTAAAAVGTVIWFLCLGMLVSSSSDHDPAAGFAAMGAAIGGGFSTVCPLILAVSIGKGPRLNPTAQLRLYRSWLFVWV